MTRTLHIHVHPDRRVHADYIKALQDEEDELVHEIHETELCPPDTIYIVDLAKFEDVPGVFERELGTNQPKGR